MAGSVDVRVWFRLADGDASEATSVIVQSTDIVDHLRGKIKESLALHDVSVARLALSSADGEVVYDDAARVPTVHAAKERALVVTGTRARSRSLVFAAAHCLPPLQSARPYREQLVRRAVLCGACAAFGVLGSLVLWASALTASVFCVVFWCVYCYSIWPERW